MNIVLLPSPSFAQLSGVSTHVHMLAKGLRAQAHNVFVIQENPLRWFRWPFLRLPEWIMGQVSLYHARRYRRWVEDRYYAVNALWQTKGAIDVLNVQNVQHIDVAKLLQYLTGCKIILTVHGYLTYEAEERKWCAVGDKTHQWLWRAEKKGYGQFDSVICVGRRLGSYVEQFTEKTATVIHNGLDMDLYHPVGEATGKSRQGRILFSGAIKEAKGIFDALRVIRLLVAEAGADVLLEIAGTGPQESAARQFVLENGLTANVVFWGAVNKERMPDFYRRGDILLCPSRQAGFSGKAEESFGYTALEAMSSGVPVVAYRTGGLPEQVIDGVTGYLADPGDVGDLANRTKELLSNEELLRTMGNAARKHCEQNFSHKMMAQRFLAEYMAEY